MRGGDGACVLVRMAAMRLNFACVLAASCLLQAAPAETVPELSVATHARIIKTVPPQDKGYWEEIPWETDLLAAAKRAHREKMMLFIWASSGHPLGCT